MPSLSKVYPLATLRDHHAPEDLFEIRRSFTNTVNFAEQPLQHHQGTSNVIITSPHNGTLVPYKLFNGSLPLGLSRDYFDLSSPIRRHETHDLHVAQLFEAVMEQIPDVHGLANNVSRLVVDADRKRNLATQYIDTIETPCMAEVIRQFERSQSGNVLSDKDIIAKIASHKADSPKKLQVLETTRKIVPGNQNLTQDDVTWRLENFYDPYHQKQKQIAQGIQLSGQTPIIIALHTCDPKAHEAEITILTHNNSRAARLAHETFKNHSSLLAEEGALYNILEGSGTQESETNVTSFTSEDLQIPVIGIEIRSDILTNPKKFKELMRVLNVVIAAYRTQPDVLFDSIPSVIRDQAAQKTRASFTTVDTAVA